MRNFFYNTIGYTVIDMINLYNIKRIQNQFWFRPEIELFHRRGGLLGCEYFSYHFTHRILSFQQSEEVEKHVLAKILTLNKAFRYIYRIQVVGPTPIGTVANGKSFVDDVSSNCVNFL